MVDITEQQICNIGQVLADTNRPLKERFRALFTLKNIGGPVSIDWISKSFCDNSALLKHELAYCLGQMQDPLATAKLVDVLEDVTQEPMVRHEAAEALGAIGLEDSIKILEKYKNDSVEEVSQTCELALSRINWLNSKETTNITCNSPYDSVDPAPPALETDIHKLKSILLNEEVSLFERYRAMFSLRNIRNQAAILALGEGLHCRSALFKHEIAFVLGQIQDISGIPFLKQSLEDSNENEMVRHECAEALGAIATDECRTILNLYLNDDKRVVKESCEIALDMCEYETSPEFQYANTLRAVK